MSDLVGTSYQWKKYALCTGNLHLEDFLRNGVVMITDSHCINLAVDHGHNGSSQTNTMKVLNFII